MDQEKPFKTIEVIDRRTSQTCKVACMSCIRGHRTTSCGIPVCRTKIFWTVKRPGRPSNSCTCRYSSTGGCRCVTSITKCTHKAKKGEKRSGECRCDEQGRFCCLLEPEHWDALLAGDKPVVDFCSSREALEAGQTTSTPLHMPATTSYTAQSPQSSGSCCGTPAPQHHRPTPITIAPTPFSVLTPQSTTLTPRFGFMGVGAPQGSPLPASSDVMAWDGQAPLAPREIQQQSLFQHFDPKEGSCCQPSTTAFEERAQMSSVIDPFDQTLEIQDFGTLPQHFDPEYAHQPPIPQPAFDFDRWHQEYLAYQHPGAICQKCGLNGCTCRNCPPVMQNFGTTSWAQCCGRKHAERSPTVVQLPVPATNNIIEKPELAQTIEQGGCCGSKNQPPLFDFDAAALDLHTDPPPAANVPPDLQHFDVDFTMPDGTDPVSFSDFLMSELDRPSHAGEHYDT